MNYNDIKFIKGITKIIIPFQFDYKEYEIENDDIVSKDSNELKSKLKLDKLKIINEKNKEIIPFKKASLLPHNLIGGLEDMMANDDKYLSAFTDDVDGDSSKIVDVYELNRDNSRELFLLDKNPNFKYDCKFKDGNNEYISKVSIRNVRVYLFESLDGFLEFECEYDLDNANEYINTNFVLCEMSYSKYDFEYKKKQYIGEGKTNEVKVNFKLQDIANKVFNFLGNIHDFNNPTLNCNNRGFSYHPQVFSYVLFDRKPENDTDLNALLFNIRKNYKGSFKFPVDSMVSNNYIYQVFDNSYWAFSLNAAVNVSFLTDDLQTNNFFKDQFENSILSTYYFLYLCVLNQRYGLAIQKGKLSQLDEYNSHYMSKKRQLKKVQKYKTNALKFKYKAFFKSPSEEEHINDYFRRLTVSQNIYELYTSFISDLNDSETIYSTLLKKLNDDAEEIKKVTNYEQDMFVALIGNIVAICQLLLAKAALIGSGLRWYDVLINLVLIVLPIITMCISVDSKVESIYSIVRDKGADKTIGKVDRKSIKQIRKDVIKHDFPMTIITRFLLFRKIDNDDR